VATRAARSLRVACQKRPSLRCKVSPGSRPAIDFAPCAMRFWPCNAFAPIALTGPRCLTDSSRRKTSAKTLSCFPDGVSILLERRSTSPCSMFRNDPRCNRAGSNVCTPPRSSRKSARSSRKSAADSGCVQDHYQVAMRSVDRAQEHCQVAMPNGPPEGEP
jgi:hypothetical protein